MLFVSMDTGLLGGVITEEEASGVPAGGTPLHRAGKYDMFIFYFFFNEVLESLENNGKGKKKKKNKTIVYLIY